MKTRVILAAAAAALLLLASFHAGHLRRELAKARADAHAAEARAANWQAQARLNAAAGAIGETRARNTKEALRKAMEAEDEIRQSSDLDAALAAYRLGLGRVRASGRQPVPDAGTDGGGPDAGR